MTNNNYPSRQRSTQRSQFRLLHILSLVVGLLLLPSGMWGGNITVRNAGDFATLTDGRYALANGNTYTMAESFNMPSGYLYVPSGATVTLDLSAFTIDRGLTSATDNGYVIKNEGTLTITGTGIITGGYNNGDGGGIYNTGILHIHGGTVQNNKATGNGAGIYHNNTTASSFTMQGAPVVTGNTVNDVANNIYLATGNVITISDALTGSNGNIKISMQTLGIFTSGLNVSTSINILYKFASDDTTIGIYDVSNEAQLQTNWSHLQDQINNVADGTPTEFQLTSGREYKASSTETCLIIPSTKKITINLNGGTLDRNLATAKDDGSGCVIKNEGELTITNGGYITGGNNTNGGGIVNIGTLKIQGGNISGNAASGNGGAIYTFNTGTLIISGGSIENNTAATNGGAIYHTGTGELTISGGTIGYNTATGNGGGVYCASSGSVTMSGGKIENNTSTDGGGIYNAQGTFIVSNGTIWSNTARGSGGGVYNVATLSVTGGKIGTGDCINTAVNGGGNYNAAAGILSISGGQIEDNTASINGGGIYADGIFNLSGNPTINKNTKSSAANNVYLPSEKKINIIGDLIGSNNIGITMALTVGKFTSGLRSVTGNYQKFMSDISPYETDEVAGEAIIETRWKALQYKLATGGTYTLGKNYSPSDLDNNVLLVVPNSKSVTLNLGGHNIDRNLASATTNGYVIQVESGGELTIAGSGNIKGGYNNGNGGGILNNGTLNIQGGSITGNRVSSGNNGAGIYNNGIFSMQGAPYVVGNYVGAGTDNPNNIYLPNIHPTITIDAVLTNMTAIGITKQSPGVFTSGLSGKGDASKFSSDNTVFETGDLGDEARIQTPWQGLQARMAAGGTITLSKDYSPLAEYDTGCLTVPAGITTTLNLDGHTINRNLTSATTDGHVIKIESTGSLTINNNGYIKGGYNSGNGGGIYNEGSLTISESHIEYNNATGDGGGIYNSGTFIHNNGYINNNNATGGGAGVYNSNVYTMTGCYIHNNAAIGDGGGIYNTNTGTLTISPDYWNQIKENSVGEGRNGGGIYNVGSMSVSNIHFYINHVPSGGKGGGVYHDGTNLSMHGNVRFDHNYSGTVADNSNVYLYGDKNINITGVLESSIIKVSLDSPRSFTSGLSGNGGVDFFGSDDTTYGVGLNSSGEAMLGNKLTITRNEPNNTYTYMYIKGDHVSESIEAIQGERVKVIIVGNGSPKTIPVTLYSSDYSLNVSYPEEGVEYSFDMPGSNVTITGECYEGGYCATSNSHDMKYYLKDDVLSFVTRDPSTYQMINYTQNTVPWRNFAYSSVNIPNSVINISPYAFYGSGLTTVTIPASVTTIGAFAFANCQQLSSITVSGGTSFEADNNVLYNYGKTNLICYPAGKATPTSYTLPASVNTIAEGAFAYGTYLQSIDVADGNTNFTASDGVLYKKDGENATAELVYYPVAKTGTTYLIPTTTTKIDPYAFHYCNNLQRVYLHHAAVPAGGEHMFDNTTCKIMVKDGLTGTYQGTANWSSYGSRIKAIRLSDATITLNYPELHWYGGYYVDFDDANPTEEKKPNVLSVVSKAGDGYTLVEGEDYTVSYTNNVNIGLATVNITGINNYEGVSGTQTFNITRNLTFTGTTGRYVTYHNTDNVNYAMPVANSLGLGTYLITGVDFTTGTITLSSAMNWIPANSPVILYHQGGCNRVHHLKVCDPGTEPLTYDDTHFKGVGTTAKDLATLKSENGGINADIYALRNEQFYRAYDGTLAANRCYIVNPSGGGGASARSLISIVCGEDNTTSIEVPFEEIFGEVDEDWYTLEGRKLNGRPTQKGIYIRDGNKVVIK